MNNSKSFPQEVIDQIKAIEDKYERAYQEPEIIREAYLKMGYDERTEFRKLFAEMYPGNVSKHRIEKMMFYIDQDEKDRVRESTPLPENVIPLFSPKDQKNTYWYLNDDPEKAAQRRIYSLAHHLKEFENLTKEIATYKQGVSKLLTIAMNTSLGDDPKVVEEVERLKSEDTLLHLFAALHIVVYYPFAWLEGKSPEEDYKEERDFILFLHEFCFMEFSKDPDNGFNKPKTIRTTLEEAEERSNPFSFSSNVDTPDFLLQELFILEKEERNLVNAIPHQPTKSDRDRLIELWNTDYRNVLQHMHDFYTHLVAVQTGYTSRLVERDEKEINQLSNVYEGIADHLTFLMERTEVLAKEEIRYITALAANGKLPQ